MDRRSGSGCTKKTGSDRIRIHNTGDFSISGRNPWTRNYKGNLKYYQSYELYRKVSYKDETLKYREYNLFHKKVPKGAEAANIQVRTALNSLLFIYKNIKKQCWESFQIFTGSGSARILSWKIGSGSYLNMPINLQYFSCTMIKGGGEHVLSLSFLYFICSRNYTYLFLFLSPPLLYR